MTGGGAGAAVSAPPLADEKTFTPHAQPGWLSWDAWSPELDFCRFVGMLQRILQPTLTLETGVGIGRVTQHLDMGCGEYVGFESNPQWRQPPADPHADSPTVEEFAAADLVILDSDPEYRHRELKAWAEHGKPGSVCVMHDCGNNHPAGSLHVELRRTVEAVGLPGVFLRNPRGGWLGFKP
jgi:hypothetical protein